MFDRLRVVPRFVVRHPWVVLGVALLLSGVAGFQARTLTINSDIAALLPPDYESVQALRRLEEAVGAETTVDVAIRSPSFDANRDYAETFVREAEEMREPDGSPTFTRIDFHREVEFLRENALYFATFEELDRLEAFLREQARTVRADNNPLRTEDFLRRDQSQEVEGRQEEIDRLKQDLAALSLSEYMLSEDSTVLAIRLVPAGAQTDIGFIDRLYERLDSLVLATRPGSYHPEMVVTPAGFLLRQSVEITTITEDVQRSFGAGAFAVIIAVVLYFLYKMTQARTGGRFVFHVLLKQLLRAPVTAVLLSVPLLMALSMAAGVASLVFGSLNLMTSALGLILFGLGIDYGIHFYARYAEERGKGATVEAAVEDTFVSTGRAIVVSALTTASALLVLQLADFRGFSEFGLIGGSGILFALLFMLTVLPALIVLAERFGFLDLRLRGEASSYEPERRVPFARAIVGVCLGAVVVSLFLLPDVRFEYNFSNLEPTYESYERRAQELEPVFGEDMLRNPAYILLENTEDVAEVAAALNELQTQDTLILAVESLQERFPSTPRAVEEKLQRLAEIRALLEDPFLAADTTGQVEMLRRAASVEEPIPLDQVPDFVTRPFTTRDGRVGNFVIVFPSGDMGDSRRSRRFAELVGEVRTSSGDTVHAASTSLVAGDMLRLMQEESGRMVGLTFLMVVLLVGLTFRSVKWTLVALLPLVVGILWMLGAMVVSGVLLTFYNLVVLPTILGIGNDGGVHIAHRYREEGRGSLRRVMRSTGEHIFMGACTNLIGFSGLLLSTHPGLRSIGLLAVIGIGSTLVAALVFFPALLQVLEDLRWFDRKPKRRRFDTGDTSRWRRPIFRVRAKESS